MTEPMMGHIRVLAQQIGARPAGSANERRAADYVCTQLNILGVESVQEQTVITARSAAAAYAPALGVGAVSLVLLQIRRTRLLGLIGLIGAALGLRGAMLLAPSPLGVMIAEGESRNITGRIPSSGEVKRFVILTAHLDTPVNHSGANDNASGIAVLLELARALRDQPLDHTEVVLLFTGASVTGAGIHAYVDQYAPPRDFTVFLNVVGVGGFETSLSYISRGGVPDYADYRPGPRITALVNRIASRHPEYGVYPRTRLIADESAPLRTRGYEAITLMGIPRGASSIPETVEQIAPEALERAVGFIQKILGELDNL